MSGVKAQGLPCPPQITEGAPRKALISKYQVFLGLPAHLTPHLSLALVPCEPGFPEASSAFIEHLGSPSCALNPVPPSILFPPEVGSPQEPTPGPQCNPLPPLGRKMSSPVFTTSELKQVI